METLQWINSGLLAFMGLLLGIVSYFLRDLHRDFKHMQGQLGELNHKHSLLSQSFGYFKKQIKGWLKSKKK